MGMVVSILGIATASMGISYSNIKRNDVFEAAYKKVMIMAWVTISFSFCVFFWIALSLGMFIENVVNVWGDRMYPLFYIGELLSLMIQWGFLFYLINIYGSPCTCCRVGSGCYTEPLRFYDGDSDTTSPQDDSPAEDCSAREIPVIIVQQPNGQMVLKTKLGDRNPALDVVEIKKDTQNGFGRSHSAEVTL